MKVADFADLGMSRQTVRDWTKAGRLHRPYRGVYTVAPLVTLAPEGQDLAAVWGCGGDALLFCGSAAVRWGMLRFGPAEPQVLAKSTGRKSPRGVDLHVTSDLPISDRTVRELIPITTVERTMLDLAACADVSDRALESAAAQAERDGWFRRPAQLRTAARARHRTGSERLRAVLSAGPRAWRSTEELLAALALIEAGLPEPVIAHEVKTDIGGLEVDLCFPAYRLILEVDGGQHLLPLNAARDRARDAALARAGWATVRVSAARTRDAPAEVVATVSAALRRRGWRPAQR